MSKPTRRSVIPNIPTNVDPNMRQFLEAVRESMQVTMGQRGNKLDSAVTFRDLEGKFGVTMQAINALREEVGRPKPEGGVIDAPTGLGVAYAFDTALVYWDFPYMSGYAYTEVFRVGVEALNGAMPSEPAFSEDYLIATVDGSRITDTIAPDFAYFYWVRHVGRNGKNSAIAGPVYAIGSDLPSKIVEDTLGQLPNDPFIQELQQRIADIDLTPLEQADQLLQTELASLVQALANTDQRLTAADQALDEAINDAKEFLEGQIASQGSSITALQSTTAAQATSLNNLTTRVGSAESSISTLNTTTGNHASRLTSIESVNTTQGTNISSLQATTASHATAISRLGAFDTTANKYAFIKNLEEVDATQASQISGLTTRMTGAESSITTLNNTTATQATSLNNLTTRVADAESEISNLNETTADQATSLNSLTTRVGSAESSITSLNNTTSSQATSLSNLTTRMGTAESGISSLNTTTSSQATSINNLTTRMGTAESGITTLNNTTASQALEIRKTRFSVGDSASVNHIASLSTSHTGEIQAPVNNANVVMNEGRIRLTGTQWMFHSQVFRVDPARRYKVRFVVRQIQDPTNGGGNLVYAGVATLDGNFNALTADPGTHRYCAVFGQALTVAQGRRVFEGVITGEGNSDYNQFRPGTVFVRPMFIVNYSGGNGIAEVESIEIRDVTEEAAVEDRSRAYVDQETGALKAERVLKVDANGVVASMGLSATSGGESRLSFVADQMNFVTTTGGTAAGALAIRNGRLVFRSAIAENIDVENLRAANAVAINFAAAGSVQLPAGVIKMDNLDNELKRRLVLTDPDAAQTGGSASIIRTLKFMGSNADRGYGTFVSTTILGGNNNTEVNLKFNGSESLSGRSLIANVPLYTAPKLQFRIRRGTTLLTIPAEQITLINNAAGIYGATIAHLGSNLYEVTGKVFSSNEPDTGGQVLWECTTFVTFDMTFNIGRFTNESAYSIEIVQTSGGIGTLEVIGSFNIFEPSGSTGGIYTSGNQTIAGVKTFSNNAIFSANVGIGTASPLYPLHVIGNAEISNDLRLSRSDASGPFVGATANVPLRLGTNGVERARINADGTWSIQNSMTLLAGNITTSAGHLTTARGVRSASVGSFWIDGHRDTDVTNTGGIVFTTTSSASAYHRWMSMRTPSGGWSQGVLGDSLFFTWASAANIDSNTNTVNNWILRLNSDGLVQINNLRDFSNVRYMKWSDFGPNTPPPAGLENVITANWLAAGVVQANILASGGLNVEDGGNKVIIHPKSSTPILFEKDGETTFSVNIDGTGFFKGSLAKDTVNAEAIQEEAKKAINPKFLGGGERRQNAASTYLTTTTSTSSSSTLQPNFNTLVANDRVFVQARFQMSQFWVEGEGPKPAWQSASYSVQFQRSVNNGANWVNIGTAQTMNVTVSDIPGRTFPGEPYYPAEMLYNYDRSFSLTDILPSTSNQVSYRVQITRTSPTGTTAIGSGPASGLRLVSFSGERSAFNHNTIETRNTVDRVWTDKESGFTIYTGQRTFTGGQEFYLQFSPTVFAEVYGITLAMDVGTAGGAQWNPQYRDFTTSGVVIRNRHNSTVVISYTVTGRVAV